MSYKNIIYLAIILAIFQINLLKAEDDVDGFYLNLKREKLKSFIQYNDEEFKDSVCNKLKDSNSKNSFKLSISTTQQCSEESGNTLVKIGSNCIFKNLFWKTRVYLGSQKLKKGANKIYNFAIDLMSPWSWVKDSTCKFHDRNGLETVQDNCEVEDYKKVFLQTENNSKQTKRCGLIAFQHEGLSVSGPFIDTRMRFKDLGARDTGIKQQRIIAADALSGLQQFKADGVLGLGKPPKDILKDENLGDLSKDYDEEEDEKQNDKDAFEEEDYNSTPFKGNPFDWEFHNTEQKTSLLKNIEDRYEAVNKNVFSIFIAENYESIGDKEFEPHLEFGNLQPEKYIYDYENYRMQWIDVLKERYYLWQIGLKKMVLHKNAEKLKFTELEERMKTQPGNTVEIDSESKSAILSLSTTKIVMPKKELEELINQLKDFYEIQCEISSKYMYSVRCFNLEDEIELDSIYLTLVFEQGQIIINPKDLIEECRKGDNKKYECIMNLQRSFDKHIVLGEAAMKNQYWVFDIDGQKVGFGPAKTKFNENALEVITQQLKEEIKDIAEDIETDIEFVIRFWAVIILVIVAIVAFKNIDPIISFIERLLGKQRVRIQPTELQQESQSSGLNETTDEFIDLREQQIQERQKEDLNNQFNDFDQQTLDSQRQGILNNSYNDGNLDDLSNEI